jgi:hypothetical protein
MLTYFNVIHDYLNSHNFTDYLGFYVEKTKLEPKSTYRPLKKSEVTNNYSK